jgi:glucose-1-phosphate thymidylyltransferase
MNKTLGIILAGGKSTRLYPATLVCTKQLLPVYDKPLIYYPLSTLMLAGIKEYVIISTPDEINNYKKLFDNCKNELGIDITFLQQEHPSGIADAFNIVEAHFQEKIFEYDNHALILGDNIFYGSWLSGLLSSIDPTVANIFLYPVQNPSDFGIATIENGKVTEIVEKPTVSDSNLAITGLYFYPPSVYFYAKQLPPSPRGELEITDINKLFLKENKLIAHKMYRGMVWFDTGTAESMLEASNFIHTIQKNQNYLIGSPHEISINRKWVEPENLSAFIQKCSKTYYGKYLHNLIDFI